jgi:carbon-monoxide dehydrogenase large subunit
VHRKEDPVLLRGKGRYSDDLSLPGQAHAVMVRSPYAHGILNGIDTTGAAAIPGVLAIVTSADLAQADIGMMPSNVMHRNRDGSAPHVPAQPRLPQARCAMSATPLPSWWRKRAKPPVTPRSW